MVATGIILFLLGIIIGLFVGITRTISSRSIGLFEEVTKLFPYFNCDPEEFERQQKIIKNMASWANNPAKFLEENMGIKLRWYQKMWIIMSSKFGNKNMIS